jgi:hypothetical protein
MTNGDKAQSVVEITVFGTPGPQGSKRLVGRDGHGRGTLIESSNKVKPWRQAVHWAVLEAKARVNGPVELVLCFTMPKPQSAAHLAGSPAGPR